MLSNNVFKSISDVLQKLWDEFATQQGQDWDERCVSLVATLLLPKSHLTIRQG